MRPGILAVALGAVLGAIGIALAFNNPTIDNTDDGTYRCFAPYDTVLMGQRDNVGDHSDAKDIEDRCYVANRDRFIHASGIAGLGAVVAAAGVAARSRQSRAR